MRHGAAKDHGIEQVWRRKIVDIGALAAQETQVLAPFHRRSDEGVLHRAPSFLHAARASSTASTIEMYPVQRQMLPDSTSRTRSASQSGSSVSSACAVVMK